MGFTPDTLRALGCVQLPDGSYATKGAVARLGVHQDEPKKAKGCQGSGEQERSLHEAIMAYCRSRCWPVVHSRMDRPATCGVGTPDFVIAMPGGRTLWIEAKTRFGKLRPEQLAWMAALRHVGHEAHVVRSMEEFVAIASGAHTNRSLGGQ